MEGHEELSKQSASIADVPTLYVRNVPGALYEKLQRWAADSGRSMNAVVLEVLEQALARRDQNAVFERKDYPELFRARLKQYGGYVAEIRAALDASSDIVYSPIEPLLLPWPWHSGRVVIGGDAAHSFAPHLTQGAAMAAEDAFVLAREVLADDVPVEARLMRYSQKRYARCAFVYTFSGQWMHDEQSVRTAADLEAARAELMLNASARIGASDRILNGPI